VQPLGSPILTGEIDHANIHRFYGLGGVRTAIGGVRAAGEPKHDTDPGFFRDMDSFGLSLVRAAGVGSPAR
jgi:hypothetical protein